MPGSIPSIDVDNIGHLAPDVVVIAVKIKAIGVFEVVIDLNVKMFGSHALVSEESLCRHILSISIVVLVVPGLRISTS